MNPVTEPDERAYCRIDAEAVLHRSFVRHVEYHTELPSTNRTAEERLGVLLDCSPALVIAGRQTAGRGRKGQAWWSSPGALTFSLVLDAAGLAVAAERRSMISLVAGLAVRHAIAEHLVTHDVRIKWPNDVQVNQRKICGILIEQHTVRGRSGLITGIGVNVNNAISTAPDDIRCRATSMCDVRNHSFDLQEVLLSILQQLSDRIRQLSTGSAALIAELNHWHCLNGSLVTLQAGDRTVSGSCQGVDEAGNLLLQDGAELLRISSGTVTGWTPAEGIEGSATRTS